MLIKIDAISDSDCRKALAAALVHGEKQHAAYEAARVANMYSSMRLENAANALKEILDASVDVARGELRRVKNEADALTQCVRSCTAKLRSHCGGRLLKKGTVITLV